jgi:serine/threonine protein kinase
MLDLMANADLLLKRPECVIIKDQRKIKVGRVPLQLGDTQAAVYIKRYNSFSLRYRLQSFFFRSGPARSLRGAAILTAGGIPTARPIASIEHRRNGMLHKSFFVSEEIKGGKTADAYWREVLKQLPSAAGYRRRRDFLRRLAELFAHLHGRRVYHNDLKDANILVVPDGGAKPEALFLLDLDGVRKYTWLSKRRRIKNLVQLNRTFGKHLQRTELLFWLKCYLPKIVDRRIRKRWARDIMRQSDRLDMRKRMPKPRDGTSSPEAAHFF